MYLQKLSTALQRGGDQFKSIKCNFVLESFHPFLIVSLVSPKIHAKLSKYSMFFSHWFIFYYHFLNICRSHYKTTNVIVFQLDNHPVFCYGFRKFAHGGWNQQLQSSELKCYQRFHVKFRLRLDNVIQIELLTVQGLETEIKPENLDFIDLW